MGDNVAETLEVMETMRVFFWKIVILHPFLWQFTWFLFVFPHIAMESHFFPAIIAWLMRAEFTILHS